MPKSPAILDSRPAKDERGVAAPDLFQCWPDQTLCRLFRDLRAVYEKLVGEEVEGSGSLGTGIERAFEALCEAIRSAGGQPGSGRSAGERVVGHLISKLKETYPQDWLQALASLLGMLMHLSAAGGRPGRLRNARRPHQEFPTYPTSPAVAKLAAESVVQRLFREPIPGGKLRAREAGQYAERALWFRLLDPSMESAQLLLGVAAAIVGKIHQRHPPASDSARTLRRALLGKLCRDCLWGIDRNRLAIPAATVVFSLLGEQWGVEPQAPQNLICGDALRWSVESPEMRFDGIISNPPWGERLRESDREWLRDEFKIIRHRADTYVAFSELAVRSLGRKGVFALILPAQALAASNAAGLRRLLVTQTKLSRIVVLPRPAFASATVRGVAVIGSASSAAALESCHVTVYPFWKRLDRAGPPHSREIPLGQLRAVAEGPWWPMLQGRSPGSGKTLPLGEIARIHLGVQLYGVGKGVPQQTAWTVRNRPFSSEQESAGSTPAIRGSDVRSFLVVEPHAFIKLGRWLARAGSHASLRRATRIFVRELCRRDGRLTAGVAKRGAVPLHGVLTVRPSGVEPHALVAILNSSWVADYVRMHAASFTKVDFQKITAGELSRLPIPVSVLNGAPRLTALARQARRLSAREGAAPADLAAEIDALVAQMYGSAG